MDFLQEGPPVPHDFNGGLTSLSNRLSLQRTTMPYSISAVPQAAINWKPGVRGHKPGVSSQKCVRIIVDNNCRQMILALH